MVLGPHGFRATSVDDFDDFEQVYPTEMNRMK